MVAIVLWVVASEVIPEPLLPSEDGEEWICRFTSCFTWAPAFKACGLTFLSKNGWTWSFMKPGLTSSSRISPMFFLPTRSKCFSSNKKFLRLALYPTSTMSPTKGIRESKKSTTMLKRKISWMSRGSPSVIWRAVYKIFKDQKVVTIEPRIGTSPTILDKPKRKPKALNHMSHSYAWLFTLSKI
ncbi:hypothetical protein EJF18_50019 [Clavispora lusitaniae]|uniref:Uncharacterized protein n=2 Tax=Clavispora lusitaniae TaxID=36911 RepID=C4Y9E5_CLAL4|nr:uncharacterized protein CLUG_04823 [Clavispora lusitaniae ATCC 42720]QFZ28804.1 hypothetical protein EJF14_50019 [Clavispora lusitaniae]EEQ40695.1 hypothetical protein CLUG_04823 [Clavispora lusitaniae ATCC 42720]QFZ34467.1 hypothetical protein EJF16_50019 [Clavispora lusitaniae]QFZ40152.1 hypothetical protein EJF15_50019 [Clavispora lusitaniae]QFZ45832.1 hypothetical protein EJF18_50019 [Clavispora lusitaniae]